MKTLAYLAHPVGHGADRAVNIANAHGWLAALVDATPWAIVAPWLPYVSVLDEGTHRDRGIADDLAALERCDLVVLTGGRVSPGMAAEARAAHAARIPVINLTSLGFAPVDRSRIQNAADHRARLAAAVRPRRVWMPPLDTVAIAELRGARAVLRANELEVPTLDAILERAEAGA